MRFLCTSPGNSTPAANSAQRVALFDPDPAAGAVTAGAALVRVMRRNKLVPSRKAWDFLTVALSAIAADAAALRSRSPDGWTRDLELVIGVKEPDVWKPQCSAMQQALSFLTTDRWVIDVFKGGLTLPALKGGATRLAQESVALLSGGLDSLVGAINLVAEDVLPLVVSQTVRGDAAQQTRFANEIGGGLQHLQLNHNVNLAGTRETSQRARSLIFIAYGVLLATATNIHSEGGPVKLYVNENGFIAINPPLTDMRVGSLSTRTAHPHFLSMIQSVLDAVGLCVELVNPYAELTKGEMLAGCRDQDLLLSLASSSTSCGRFQRWNYNHCGRCLPCQVRRAAFLRWEETDETGYVFDNLGIRDEDHAGFDDVRSVAMARLSVEMDGLSSWLGPALSSPAIKDRSATRDMVERGLTELGVLHDHYGVT